MHQWHMGNRREHVMPAELLGGNKKARTDRAAGRSHFSTLFNVACKRRIKAPRDQRSGAYTNGRRRGCQELAGTPPGIVTRRPSRHRRVRARARAAITTTIAVVQQSSAKDHRASTWCQRRRSRTLAAPEAARKRTTSTVRYGCARVQWSAVRRSDLRVGPPLTGIGARHFGHPVRTSAETALRCRAHHDRADGEAGRGIGHGRALTRLRPAGVGGLQLLEPVPHHHQRRGCLRPLRLDGAHEQERRVPREDSI